MRRGEVWWASLPEPSGPGQGFRGPLVVVSADSFNASRIATVVGAVISSNLALAGAPGNVRLPVRGSGLSRPSVVNVSQLVTVDKSFLTGRIGKLSPRQLAAVDDGIRLALSV